ncbi:uncharacterized protein LOC111019463 [Momordica charantia]|uniref:Uncharacterized protein LOC111019463 n=1 Tax=Momordica charantia TaxID=3673 RepID=A0A6J1DCG9_MOMCH|nr:uncharacterized protein LOC111019463 [Momordica charantia]
MAPVPKNTKSHFTHPNHPLLHHSDGQDYCCDACKTSGSGSRFRCHACDFNLHEYCADCPQKLPSFLHRHPLALVVRKAQGARQNDRICDVCRGHVEGLFYRCKDCDFDVHPLCTQLPNQLRHVIDPNHSLNLHKPSSASCAVCKIDCSSLWVYGCDVCRLNIHLDCLLQPYGSPSDPSPAAPPASRCASRGIPFAPPPQWATGPPPFSYGHFGNFGYGYAAPYGVPDYPFGFPHYYHGSMYGNANIHQGSQGGNVVGPPPPPPSASSGGKLGKSMFALVGKLTVGVMSSFVFGSPFGVF